MDKWMSVPEAAQELGVTRGRINAMIRAGRLHATKIGRNWVVTREDLEAVRIRKTGHPVTTGAGLRRKDRREEGGE